MIAETQMVKFTCVFSFSYNFPSQLQNGHYVFMFSFQGISGDKAQAEIA